MLQYRTFIQIMISMDHKFAKSLLHMYFCYFSQPQNFCKKN